jgi:hypothetical protein
LQAQNPPPVTHACALSRCPHLLFLCRLCYRVMNSQSHHLSSVLPWPTPLIALWRGG